MQFPSNLVLLGASASAAIAILVCGRLLIATVRELGNPELDPKARRFIGYWALGVALAILVAGAAVTMMAYACNLSPPDEDSSVGHARQGFPSGTRDPELNPQLPSYKEIAERMAAAAYEDIDRTGSRSCEIRVRH